MAGIDAKIKKASMVFLVLLAAGIGFLVWKFWPRAERPGEREDAKREKNQKAKKEEEKKEKSLPVCFSLFFCLRPFFSEKGAALPPLH